MREFTTGQKILDAVALFLIVMGFFIGIVGAIVVVVNGVADPRGWAWVAIGVAMFVPGCLVHLQVCRMRRPRTPDPAMNEQIDEAAQHHQGESGR